MLPSWRALLEGTAVRVGLNCALCCSRDWERPPTAYCGSRSVYETADLIVVHYETSKPAVQELLLSLQTLPNQPVVCTASTVPSYTHRNMHRVRA